MIFHFPFEWLELYGLFCISFHVVFRVDICEEKFLAYFWWCWDRLKVLKIIILGCAYFYVVTWACHMIVHYQLLLLFMCYFKIWYIFLLYGIFSLTICADVIQYCVGELHLT